MRSIVRIYLMGLFKVTGTEDMPRSGALLVCSNHIGTIDPPLLPAFLPRSDTWSMAKAEWFTKPANARLFRWYHAFPIVRHSPDRRGLRRALDVLQAGGALVVYPEGTRVDSGGLKEAEPGAGFIARISGATVQPVALIGTRDCLPRHAHWPRRVPVEIRLGSPLRVREQRPNGERVQNQEAADAIMLAIAELLPAELRGRYAELESLRRRLDGVYEPALAPVDHPSAHL